MGINLGSGFFGNSMGSTNNNAQNGGILNEDDSSINIPLKSDDEIFDLHLYKGSLKEENITKITVKAVIDGKLYEDFILLK